ncbi:DNA phosphorothioation-associated putative methyltransferase [Phenylobacterium sp.]|uniref:DNA phosphorothioation-associated putative methyltransferase n=1 Tax=Phenylobacterium sp. TaxID=1871053 RepID=UPI002FE3563D
MDRTPEASAAEVGKRVGEARYLHRDGLNELSPKDRRRILDAEDVCGASNWNVVKLRGEGAVSLLTYEDFERPFPRLLESLTVDLEQTRVTRRSYWDRANPPVLHRKELLLPRDDPRRPRYAALTAQLEARGLLQASRRIGTLRGWQSRLAAAGISVVGHDVRAASSEPPPVIYRHRAAIARDGLSAPVQALIERGVLTSETSVFDYGCGLGSDVAGLRRLGISANGWDPYFAPDAPRVAADVVNLGFVLNVIECAEERREALSAAYGLARRCLAVAVISASSARMEMCRPYRDGFVTSRGTFQKYFTWRELKDLIESALGSEAHAVGPRMFFVFKDALAEQAFLLARITRVAAAGDLQVRAKSEVAKARLESLRPEFLGLQELIEQLGRWPADDEIAADLQAGLIAKAGSIRRALQLARDVIDLQHVEAAAKRRRDDLCVYFALNAFDGRAPYKRLPPSLQRDVRALFGDYVSALAAGRELLFSAGQSERIESAIEDVAGAGLGFIEAEEGFWAHAALIERLPSTLRVLVGCAERCNGGLGSAHVVKIHLRSRKVSLLRYPGFDTSPIPRLKTRVKIDLARRGVREFDHWGEDQRLLFKSQLMAPDQPGYAEQAAFDEGLRRKGLDRLGLRATSQELRAALQPATGAAP